jgi:clan AA aspartic protease (TIGR02281 family)
LIGDYSLACTSDADCDWKCFLPKGAEDGACVFDAEHLKKLQAAAKHQRRTQEAARAQAGRERLQRERKVELRRNRAGHYVAKGLVNGAPVLFIVDTGATDVVLPLSLARRLGLQLYPGGSTQTANGVVETRITRLDSVDVGGIVVRDVRASVLDNMSGDGVLLGMSYLGQLEMSQRGDTLTLQLHQ